jgi:Skp family chaperone for outer membrane proteins
MKFLLVVTLALFSFGSFAEKHGDLNQKKQMMTSHIDQRIEALESSKNCINQAASEKALKECKKEKKQAMKDIKESKQEQKEELGFDKKQREEEGKQKEEKKQYEEEREEDEGELFDDDMKEEEEDTRSNVWDD